MSMDAPDLSALLMSSDLLLIDSCITALREVNDTDGVQRLAAHRASLLEVAYPWVVTSSPAPPPRPFYY
jgi:hypothetical protein